jgi:adenosine deaminase
MRSIPLEYSQYLRRVPKVELHCHVEGTLRPATVVELARKHDIALPTTEVDRIYAYETIYDFLEIFRLVNSTVIDRDDFARVAYESLEDGARLGNLKYREMFFNPTLHTARGVPMATVIDGLIDGCKAAEREFGTRCFLIADVYRQDPPDMARQMTEEVIANRRPEVIGLGMDAAEAPDPPEKFVESFHLAGRAGLHRTSHSAEPARPPTSPPASICWAANESTTATTSSTTRRWWPGAGTRGCSSPAARRRPRWSTDGRT